MTAQELFLSALSRHQEARLPEAEALYRKVLEIEPTHRHAIHNLGLIAYQSGRHETAVELVKKSIAISDTIAPAPPDDLPEFLWNLGVIYQAQGASHETFASYARSLDIQPTAHRLIFLADLLLSADADAQALTYYKQALKFEPDNVQALTGFGEALRRAGLFKEGQEALDRAYALEPHNSDVLCNIGATHYSSGKPAEAEDYFRRSIAINPQNSSAYSNLCELLRQLGRADEAISYCRKALEFQPNSPLAHDNLANALKDLGDIDGAERHFRQAIQLAPGFGKACANLGMMRLLAGDFREGWERYEGRWQAELADVANRFKLPWWNPNCPRGSSVLIHPEQGIGDFLQFVRYVPLVIELGFSVVLETPGPLVALARRIAGAQIVAPGEPLPRCDFQIPLLSLPRAFGTTLETIPAAIPYLRADRHKIETQKRKLGGYPGINVGLTWAGNPSLKNDAMRTIPLPMLTPLLAIPHVRVFAMQKELRSGDTEALVALGVVNLAAECGDFDDTASIVSALDLIVSVDTSIVHLAGALGRPVWVMLPNVPDWRWLMERRDSPWYPTARLFRQNNYRDWTNVIADVRSELTRFAARPDLTRPLPPA